MPATSILPPFAQFTDRTGEPLQNGYIYIGSPGLDAQTNPITAYWDDAFSIPAAQPIRTTGGYPYRNGTPARVYVPTDFSITVLDGDGAFVYGSLTGAFAGGGSGLSAFYADRYTATAGQTTFTLTTNPASINALDVSVNGSTLVPGDDFTWVSTTVTLTAPLVGGERVLIRYTASAGTATVLAGSVTDVAVATGSVLHTSVIEGNPQFYGAQANGTTDDTTEIQAAIDASDMIQFEANKTYIISAPLTLTNRSKFTIRGNGATIKAANGMTVGSGTQLMKLTGCVDFEISDLAFDGNRANRTPAETTSHLLQFENCREFTIRNVEANNGTTDGFYFGATNRADSTTYTRDFVVDNCRATNAYRNCASFINTLNATVIGGYFTNATGTAPQAGVDVEADAGSVTPSNRSIRFIGVKFTGNVGYGLQLSSEGSPEDVSVENCYFADNTGGGLLTGIPVRVIGGLMESMSAKGVDVQSVATARATVIGMEFKNFTTAACVDDGSLSGGITLIGCRFNNIAIAATPSGARFAATDCEIDTATGIGFSLSTAATRASIKGCYIKAATGRAIYSVATDSEFIGNRAVDIASVSGGYYQITGARSVVLSNSAEATVAATTTIGFYVDHLNSAIAFNRCVNLHSTDPYSVQGSASATSAFIGFNAGGTAKNPRNLTSAITVPVSTVANLPTGSSGMRAQVTDANATTFQSIVAAGGANVVPVYHDGTNWRIG